jgi:hypothetical protein
MKNGFLLVICCLFFWIPSAFAQKSNFLFRYIKRLANDTTSNARPQFLVYPTIGYAPETSWEIGLSSLYVYYAKGDTTNRLSEVNGFTFFTLENQYGLWFDHNIFTDKNKWIFPGRIRYQSFPVLFHGIGPDSPSEYIALVNTRQLQIKERALRQVLPNFYAGLEMDFQRLSSVSFVPATSAGVELPIGGTGSANLALGMGLMYDTRHNVLNVRKGIFSELAVLRYDKTWGSDFAFTTVISDNRFYKSINERDVLAAQVLGQFNVGNTPFNQLALLGGESINRGYYLGRFRDKNQLAAQVEYRMLPFPFAKRWGAAVFGSSGTVFNDFSKLSFDNIVWSGGAGVRFLIFPKKDVYTRLDVALTNEGPGFYFFIGEAF